MTEITLRIIKTSVAVVNAGTLTSGMVGVPVTFAFDDSWNGLVKTAVFRGGDVTRDCLLDGTLTTTVPAECLAVSGVPLKIGVEGRTTDGEIVIPTVWGFVGKVLEGAQPGGDPGAEPENPVWLQILKLIGLLENLTTTAKENLVAAINELAARPSGDVDADEVRGIIEEYLEENLQETAESYSHPTPMDYGAAGDGATDDTVAFQTALAQNRVVYVPGGIYLLSGTLVIRENCCLKLSQDTVLQFSQTSGNCIVMQGSATLRGNHAIISVPYAFTGNVVAIDTNLETDTIITPYLKVGSHMFKRQRFVYDVNIIKQTSAGFMRSADGGCSGTAIYMSADSTIAHMWLWAITMSGIRIAGAFSYGIRAVNYDSASDSEGHYEDDAWNHDMRIEAVIEACEIGVALENCNGAHIAVTIQPSAAMDGTAYAKHGVYLNDAKFIDMIGSRVWDWKDTNTLVSVDSKYQHIALIGQCRGLILDDFMFHESGTDIRDLIYTDTASNLEKMTILQEPITRWFKPVDGKPYFSDGTLEKPLMLREEMEEFFVTERIQGYSDALASAIDTDGTIYNGIGYARNGGALNSGGTLVADTEAWYGHTGYIACKPGDVLYLKNFDFSVAEGYTKAFAFDENFTLLGQNNIAAIIDGTTTGVFSGSMTDDGCTLTVVKTGTAYMRIGFKSTFVGSDPIISVNNEIKYIQSGFLSEGVKVKGSSVVLYSPGGKTFGLSVDDSGTLTAAEITVE